MNLDCAHWVTTYEGWPTAFLAVLRNPDFAAWRRGEGVWEIRSSTALRARFAFWHPVAACRTRDDAEVTLATVLAQARAGLTKGPAAR